MAILLLASTEGWEAPVSHFWSGTACVIKDGTPRAPFILRAPRVVRASSSLLQYSLKYGPPRAPPVVRASSSLLKQSK